MERKRRGINPFISTLIILVLAFFFGFGMADPDLSEKDMKALKDEYLALSALISEFEDVDAGCVNKRRQLMMEHVASRDKFNKKFAIPKVTRKEYWSKFKSETPSISSRSVGIDTRREELNKQISLLRDFRSRVDSILRRYKEYGYCGEPKESIIALLKECDEARIKAGIISASTRSALEE